MRRLTITTVLLLGIWPLLLVVNGQNAPSGGIRGEVVDPLGALVSKATVTFIDESGAQRSTQTNREGAFSIKNLAPGKYIVRATAVGFAPYEDAEVEVTAGKISFLAIKLTLTVAEEVTVDDEQAVNTNPDANASATVLRGTDIEALPDDSEELAAALQALAGPAAGPNGGEVFIDGFSGGRLPPRDTIREIRINQNPFSPEYDRLGFGRIEIFTKPGTDKLRGEVEFEFEDEAFNSRNPFAPNRTPFQVRNFNVNLGGPFIKNRVSYFIDFEHESADNNAVINALILNPDLNVTPFQVALLTPSEETEFRPRIDLKLNEANTLTGSYGFSRSQTENGGIGGFDLLSRAFNSESTEHVFRLTETAVLNASTVNESRFQYIRDRSSQRSIEDTPTIRVLDAFTSGGANVGVAFSNVDRFELQNHTSFLRGSHSLKAGVRLRHYRVSDSSPGNFLGTFTFTSLDQYRNTILNLPGAFPTQFSIAGGDPLASVRQTDLGLFVLDDWRVKPQLTLSLGMRYETQTNISSKLNFAPRFSFAYAPGAGGQNRPKTVFRGGFGIFYDRISDSLTLQAVRYNGINQQQFVVTDPGILDQALFTRESVSNLPTIESLSVFAQPQTTRIVSPRIEPPYTIQSAFAVERQLPHNTTLSVTYVNAQTRRLLRSRNINAPLNGARPLPKAGNIFQYESTGRFNQHQLILNVRSNFNERASLFTNYAFGGAKSDSDGAGNFPADSYDLSGEYGRALVDIRHRFVLGGFLRAPFRVSFSPFITFRSGVPFNITTGADANGDTVFAERPAFARDLEEPGIIVTRFGGFDPTPDFGDSIIPRNYARGPEFFVVNLRASKEFGFGGNQKDPPSMQGGG
ncbi:MAG TPA: TonB-dependent receptor, partial [Pyrinomonadaceae bacterium]|nr:TonB-dependent receptor [Pyrinomonadaceae bacterium]